jgi:hypothetical protein
LPINSEANLLICMGTYWILRTIRNLLRFMLWKIVDILPNYTRLIEILYTLTQIMYLYREIEVCFVITIDIFFVIATDVSSAAAEEQTGYATTSIFNTACILDLPCLSVQLKYYLCETFCSIKTCQLYFSPHREERERELSRW